MVASVTATDDARRSDMAIPLHLRAVLFCSSIVVAFTDSSMLYFCCFVAFSWLGSFVSVFFFGFHLLDIVHRSPTLQVCRALV
jgi:hypothetical protein